MKNILLTFLLACSQLAFSQVFYTSSTGTGNPGSLNTESDDNYMGWTSIGLFNDINN